MGSDGKPSSRAAKAADKEAEVIFKSLGKASEAAVETTLNSIVERLRGNTPLMYHIAAMLNNPEWTGVLEAAALGQAVATSGGDKPDTKRPLRSGAKKFSHLLKHI